MKKKYRVFIADDEPLAVSVLKCFIENHPQCELIGVAHDGLTASKFIKEFKPDLAFLDIKMPELNGIEVALQVLNEFRLNVIFTTAYDQFAVKAFELNAIDYLLKPFDEDRFIKAISTFIKHGHQLTTNKIINALEKLESTELHPGNTLSRILVKEKGRLIFVKTDNVLFFEADGDYVKIVTHLKTYMINNSLNNLEHLLDKDAFARIHRSFIVNLNFIKEFIPYANGEFIVILENEIKLKLTRNYKKNIKVRF